MRAELALLHARGPLVPGKIDQGQRRVAYSEKLVALLEAAARTRRRREDDASLHRIREQCREAAERADSLGQVAAEIQQFAETLWGTVLQQQELQLQCLMQMLQWLGIKPQI